MNFDEGRREIWKLMDANHFFTLKALQKRLGWQSDEVAFLLRDMGFETTRASIKPGGSPKRLWAKRDLIQQHRVQNKPIYNAGLSVFAD